MSVGGAHVVDDVGKIRHGLCYGGVAVQLGCGAENGRQLRGIAERAGQMRGIRADIRLDIGVERLLMRFGTR